MLDDALGYLVKQAHLRMMRVADAALESLGVDRKEYGVLQLLSETEALSQQSVASSLGVDPTTMVALIDSLEAKGIVVRKPDPTDRRRNAVELTARGRSTWGKASAAYDAAEREFLAPLSDEQSAQFRQALLALAAANH